MALTPRTQGPSPEVFWKENRAIVLAIINGRMLQLENALIKATPFSDGILRGGWTIVPATITDPTAVIGQTRDYFFPVEFGRKPGKGISREGQEAVEMWAKRKLGMGQQEAQNFAFLLSRKYKLQGRPANGFAGLAREGQIPRTSTVPDELVPIQGGLIDTAFKQIDGDFNRIFG